MREQITQTGDGGGISYLRERLHDMDEHLFVLRELQQTKEAAGRRPIGEEREKVDHHHLRGLIVTVHRLLGIDRPRRSAVHVLVDHLVEELVDHRADTLFEPAEQLGDAVKGYARPLVHGTEDR
jgi:hypothetical protein